MLRKVFLGLALAAAFAAPAAADQVSAVKAAKGMPKVIDALADGGGNLYVSVKNDRTDWDGFAAQVCEAVKPHKARIFQVRVVDVSTVFFGRKPSDWGKLGEAKCGK